MMAAVVLTSASFTACEEDYTSPFKGLTMADITLEGTADSYKVTLQDQVTATCYASADDSWCHIDAQGNIITITVDANTTYSERHTKVTFSDTGDNTSVSFGVTQKQNNAIFAAEDIYEAPEAGGQVEINVKSNVDYDVQIPADADWLTIASTRALVDSKVTLTAEANESGANRQAVVTLINKSTDTKGEVLVTQVFTPVIQFADSLANVEEVGGQITVAFDANIDVAITTNADWITIGEQQMIEKKKYSVDITIAKNRSQDEREGTVIFSGGAYGIERKFTVKQAFTPVLIFEQESYEADEHGGEIVIDLTTNLDLDVTSDGDFLEFGELEQSGDEDNYRLKVQVSPSDERIRTAEIRFTPTYAKWSDKAAGVTITQKKQVMITETTDIFFVGEIANLAYENITGADLVWKSSNTSIAAVDNSGRLTVYDTGDVVITATSADGVHSDSKEITCTHMNNYLAYNFEQQMGDVKTIDGKVNGYHLVCELTNNSSRTITLLQCDMYVGGSYVGTEFQKKVLNPGQSITATLMSARQFTGSYRFDWQYSLGSGSSVGSQVFTFQTYR